MLKAEDAERIISEELEASGHRVLRVDVCLSIHPNQAPFPAIAALCLGEPKLYDTLDVQTLLDEPSLRDFVRLHWLATVG